MERLKPYLPQVIDACHHNGVKHLYVFGSILKDSFNDESDIDFTVDFETNDPLIYTDNYFNLLFKLEDIFGREIDLLEERALRNPVFKRAISSQKQLLYGH